MPRASALQPATEVAFAHLWAINTADEFDCSALAPGTLLDWELITEAGSPFSLLQA